jgi:hypothetical protein
LPTGLGQEFNFTWFFGFLMGHVPLQEIVMNPTLRLHGRSAGWHFDSNLAPHVDAYLHYLSEHCYAPKTIDTYLRCVAHFAYWMRWRRLAVHRLDEGTVWRFLDEHLPRCDCPTPVCRTRTDLRAALGHLLVVLRAKAIVTEPAPEATPVTHSFRTLRS